MKTLYVRRDLLNASEVVDWAKSQGFPTTMEPGQLHVTVAYSKTPIEWPEPTSYGNVEVPFGQNRMVEPLGDGGAMVLRFHSPELEAGWKRFMDAGASWDFDGYKPHVTVSWDAASVDLMIIEPFKGTLIFGPEIYEEINEDWKDNLTEKARTFSEVFHKTAANVVKVDDSLGLVFGWAIVSKIEGAPYFDLHGDYIPEDSMLKASTEFMLSDREAKVMHVGKAQGKIVFAFPITEDIAKAFGMTTKQTGLLIAMKPDDPEVLAKFRDGTYTGFSMGGSRVKDEPGE